MTKITGDVTLTDATIPDSFPRGSNAWRVELRYQGRSMTVPFYTGPALGEPTVADVVECLISDASGADQSFEDWCSDYGYDTDSRKDEATYKAVVKQTRELRRLLGDQTIGRLAERGEIRSQEDGSVLV